MATQRALVIIAAVALLPLALGCGDWKAALEKHNEYRADHGADELEWSDDLEASARAWAKQVAKTCDGSHSPQGDRDSDYGENILWGKGWNDPDLCVIATDGWYSECKNYKYTDTPFSSNDWTKVGHFTMMIWRATGKIGCAGAASGSGKSACSAVVCHYLIRGNDASNSAWAANVGRLVTVKSSAAKKKSKGSRRMLKLSSLGQFMLSSSPAQSMQTGLPEITAP